MKKLMKIAVVLLLLGSMMPAFGENEMITRKANLTDLSGRQTEIDMKFTILDRLLHRACVGVKDESAYAIDTATLGALTIPSSIEVDGVEYQVTMLGRECFSDCMKLTEINIPEGVDSLMRSCLNTIAVKHITLPQSLKYIEQLAFANSYCNSIDLGGTEEIDSLAFLYCDYLEQVNFGTNLKSIGDNAFYNCVSLKNIVLPQTLETIGSGAFYFCNSLETADLGGVVGIGNEAFNKAFFLTEVKFGNRLKSIGKLAFNQCFALKRVTLPPTVEHVDYGAFLYDKELTTVDLGNVITLGDYAFYGDGKLSHVTFGNRLETVGESAIRTSCPLSEVVLPPTTRSIGAYAFGDCNITRAICGNPETIGEGAFYKCSQLAEIDLGTKLTAISDMAFTFCSSLEELLIPATVESIGKSAFMLMTNLKHTNIPKNVGNYGWWYYGDQNLETIDLDADNPNFAIEDGTLLSKDKSTLYTYLGGNVAAEYTLPKTVTSLTGESFEDGHNLENIWVEQGSENFASVEGMLYDKRSNALVAYPAGRRDTTAVIPSMIESLAPSCFGENDYVCEIVIPSSVKQIGMCVIERNESLKRIIAESETPATAEADAFIHSATSNPLTLYVPAGSESAYAEAEGWKHFQKIIPVASTAINHASIAASQKAEYYDISGRRISSLRQGLNIIHTSDGRIKKVIRK